MLVRLGKSLIFVTIVITLIFVVSSSQIQSQATPFVINALASERTEGIRDDLIYIVLGSYLAVMSILLVFLAVKGRRVNAEL
jgi:hypothetical protein